MPRINNGKSFISSLNVWNAFSCQPYKFDQYAIGSIDFGGNKVTGVPPTINVSGANVKSRNDFYLTITFNSTSSIPLNDANSVYCKGLSSVAIKIWKEIHVTQKYYQCFCWRGQFIK